MLAFLDLFLFLMKLLVSQTIYSRIVRLLQNNELETMWKDADVRYWRYYLGFCLVRLSKIILDLCQDSRYATRDSYEASPK
jgi:hypothetical protein